MWKLEVWFWIFVAVFNTGRSSAENKSKAFLDLAKAGAVHNEVGGVDDSRPRSSGSGASDPLSACTAERPSAATSSKSSFTPISGGGW